MVKTKWLYSAYDLQCGRYFDVGLNSRTKKHCIKEVREHLALDTDEEDKAEEAATPDKLLLAAYGFEIVRHKKPL